MVVSEKDIQKLSEYTKQHGVSLFTFFDPESYTFKIMLEKFNLRTIIKFHGEELTMMRDPYEYIKAYVLEGCDLLQKCKY